MYEAYWKLRHRPFENAFSEESYYPSESAQGSLLKLRYAVENRRGAALLAGASGLGKTLLARMLLSQLPEQFSPRVHLVVPTLPSEQLWAYLAAQLGAVSQTGYTPSLADSLLAIELRLSENTRQGNHAVIVVDEAHLVTEPETLETLRLLTNFETDGQLDLSLMLTGQTELLVRMQRFQAFDSRLAVKCLMQPFPLEETIAYVNHRLRSAGGEQEIFSPEAIERLHLIAGGIPRQINRLCDLALLIGYAEDRPTLDADQIEAIHQEMVAVVPE